MGRACKTNWEKRNAYGMLAVKSEGKMPLWRPRRRLSDNIKMDLKEIGWGCVDRIELAQNMDHWGNSCEHCNKPSGSIKCWEVLE
jgi:hypothetical protein